MLTEHELEQSTGNVRIKYIDFELVEHFVDVADIDRKRDSFYLGKVGSYEPGSYHKDPFSNLACISVCFANGEAVTVNVSGVALTDEHVTPVEFLPTASSDSAGYSRLTDSEKEFADKVFLTLLSRSDNTHANPDRLMQESIGIAITRTHMYEKLKWDKTVEE